MELFSIRIQRTFQLVSTSIKLITRVAYATFFFNFLGFLGILTCA